MSRGSILYSATNDKKHSNARDLCASFLVASMIFLERGGLSGFKITCEEILWSERRYPMPMPSCFSTNAVASSSSWAVKGMVAWILFSRK